MPRVGSAHSIVDQRGRFVVAGAFGQRLIGQRSSQLGAEIKTLIVLTVHIRPQLRKTRKDKRADIPAENSFVNISKKNAVVAAYADTAYSNTPGFPSLTYYFFRFIYFLAICLAMPSIWAEDAIVERAFIEGPGRRITLHQVQTQPFTPYAGVLSRGYTPSAIELKLTISPGAQEALAPNIPHAHGHQQVNNPQQAITVNSGVFEGGLIRNWNPWEQSTGPTSLEGKANAR